MSSVPDFSMPRTTVEVRTMTPCAMSSSRTSEPSSASNVESTSGPRCSWVTCIPLAVKASAISNPT